MLLQDDMERKGNNLLASYRIFSMMRWQNVLNTETSLINTELIPAFSSTLKLSSHLELQHKVDHQALLAEVQ